MVYRRERLLDASKKLRRERRRELLNRAGTHPRDAVRGREDAAYLLRCFEADGYLPEDLLDEFEYSIRAGVRELMGALRPKTLAFNAMASKILHGQNMANRRDQNVARGLSAVAMLAVEERVALALHVLLVEMFRQDYAELEADFDFGDQQQLLKLVGGERAGVPPS